MNVNESMNFILVGVVMKKNETQIQCAFGKEMKWIGMEDDEGNWVREREREIKLGLRDSWWVEIVIF